MIYTCLYPFVFGIEMTKTKKEYLTPQLTVVQFKVERGYAASTLANISLAADAANHFIEARTNEGNLWTENLNGDVNPSIENRTDNGSIANEGWLANDAGGYI